jgi:hypothetical protein
MLGQTDRQAGMTGMTGMTATKQVSLSSYRPRSHTRKYMNHRQMAALDTKTHKTTTEYESRTQKKIYLLTL